MTGSISLESLPSVGFDERTRLPRTAGIYFALAADGSVLYVGQAVNIARRWAAHHRVKQLAEIGCARIAWLSVENAEQLDALEGEMISGYLPALNGTKVDYPDGLERVSFGVGRDLIARLDAAVERMTHPYKPPSRNSVLQVAIREHVEKLEAQLTVKPADPTPAPPSRGEGEGGGKA